MGTQATYEFRDQYERFFVYGYCDGYPSGAVEKIAAAVPYAWKLPRFEAADFAAAFVRANKAEGGGNIHLTTGHDAHDDTWYQYIVTFATQDGKLIVETLPAGSKETLESMLARFNCSLE